MKNTILIFFLVIVSKGFCQLNPAQLKLKNKEVINVIGRIKPNNYFKYKRNPNDKIKKIHFSKIDYVKMKNVNNILQFFRYFNVSGRKRGVVVEELILGSKVNLYATITIRQINQGGFVVPVMLTNYYAKKSEEDVLTRLGVNDSFTNQFKQNTKHFFEDCKELITKIESKDFKARTDINDIVHFYNTNCN